jgi:7-cyano-7-deazaguanine synthase
MLAGLAKRYNIHPLYIRHGLRWENAELRHLRRFLRATSLPPVTVLRLPVRDLYGAHWSLSGKNIPGTKSPDEAVYLPGRNLLLLAKAAVFCAQRGIGTIAIGSLGHNPFADATPVFFRHIAAAAGEALGVRLRVIAPLRGLTKQQVIRHGRGLPLHLSFSCINPKRGGPCGRCNKCAERQRAFHIASADG